jgi:hypothetical protein
MSNRLEVMISALFVEDEAATARDAERVDSAIVVDMDFVTRLEKRSAAIDRRLAVFSERRIFAFCVNSLRLLVELAHGHFAPIGTWLPACSVDNPDKITQL